MLEMDRGRASRMGFAQYSAVGDGVNLLVIDSQPALPDEHWIVDSLAATSFNTAAPAVFLPSFSGLYLCPPGTPPPLLDEFVQGVELPLDGGGDGWSTFSVIPAGVVYISFKRFVVPPGWFIRSVMNNAGGTPVTYSAQLLFTYVREKQC